MEPIVGPLCRIVEQLPTKTLKAFEKSFNGIALAVGAFAIVGPDLTHELQLRRDERANREEEETGIRRKQRTGPVPPQGATGNGNGRVRQGDAGQPANGAPDWTATLPEGDAITDYGLSG